MEQQIIFICVICFVLAMVCVYFYAKSLKDDEKKYKVTKWGNIKLK